MGQGFFLFLFLFPNVVGQGFILAFEFRGANVIAVGAWWSILVCICVQYLSSQYLLCFLYFKYLYHSHSILFSSNLELKITIHPIFFFSLFVLF